LNGGALSAPACGSTVVVMLCLLGPCNC
jgi:hypothetical protein